MKDSYPWFIEYIFVGLDKCKDIQLGVSLSAAFACDTKNNGISQLIKINNMKVLGLGATVLTLQPIMLARELLHISHHNNIIQCSKTWISDPKHVVYYSCVQMHTSLFTDTYMYQMGCT